MTRREPIDALVASAASLYVQLQARVAPEQGRGGTRIQPGSKPTIAVDVVSHMEALVAFLHRWSRGAEARLRPMVRVDLTARQGLKCPWCSGKLVAWLRSVEDLEPSEVQCVNPEHDQDDGPAVWAPNDWPRLGLLVGSYTHASYGPKIPGHGGT
jgi:hypothetical protein